MVIPGGDGACLLVSYRPLARLIFKCARRQTSQTSVYIRCEHRTDAVLDLHGEHRLFRGALSPHRALEPCPRILL